VNRVNGVSLNFLALILQTRNLEEMVSSVIRCLFQPICLNLNREENVVQMGDFLIIAEKCILSVD
jgi:hypothetical protein